MIAKVFGVFLGLLFLGCLVALPVTGATVGTATCDDNQGQMLVATENGGDRVILPTSAQTSTVAVTVQNAQAVSADTTLPTAAQQQTGLSTTPTLTPPRHPLILPTMIARNEAGFADTGLANGHLFL